MKNEKKMLLKKLYQLWFMSDHIILKIVDFISTVCTVFAVVFFIILMKNQDGQKYISEMFSLNVKIPFVLLFVMALLVFPRMLVRSMITLVRNEPSLPEPSLPYFTDLNESKYCLDKLITDDAKKITVTAQNWASSFSQLKARIKWFLEEGKSSKEAIVILTEPKIMKEIFQPATGRDSITCYEDYVNEGGTLYQIHSWLNSLSPEGRKKIKIYIHPGATSLSSHLVEYITKSDVLVITPKYATAPAPYRLSLVIKHDQDLDAWRAITTPLNSMSQPVNKRIEDLFREFHINNNAI